MNIYFSQFGKLMKLLAQARIPFSFNPLFNGYQLHYYDEDGKEVCDVICHSGSYGSDDGLLEMMGLVPEDWDDTVIGYLTAEEAFERIFNHWFGIHSDIR